MLNRFRRSPRFNSSQRHGKSCWRCAHATTRARADRRLIAVSGDDVDEDTLVDAPRNAFGAIELDQLFGGEQIEHAPGTSAGLGLDVADATLAGTDRQVEAEAVVEQARRTRGARSHPPPL